MDLDVRMKATMLGAVFLIVSINSDDLFQHYIPVHSQRNPSTTLQGSDQAFSA